MQSMTFKRFEYENTDRKMKEVLKDLKILVPSRFLIVPFFSEVEADRFYKIIQICNFG